LSAPAIAVEFPGTDRPLSSTRGTLWKSVLSFIQVAEKNESLITLQNVDPTARRLSGHAPGLCLPDPRHWYSPSLDHIEVEPALTSDIASGLYYLSELVEEHTVIAKKLLTRLIYSVVVIQVLLVLLDGFPFLLSMLSIGSHIVYLGNMRRFPVVKLSDPLFLTSCGTGISIPSVLRYRGRVLTFILA
jgi:hypothetical protein